jgi:hypothetical protein
MMGTSPHPKAPIVPDGGHPSPGSIWGTGPSVAADATTHAAAMNDTAAIHGLTGLPDLGHRALTAPPQTLLGGLEQIRWMVARGARRHRGPHRRRRGKKGPAPPWTTLTSENTRG